MFKNFNDELMEQTISNSTSFCNVCTNLGITSNGSNISALRLYIEENNIDISHFIVRKSPITKEEYYKNPKYCKYCGQELPFEKRNNDFCSHSCSASYNNKGTCRNKKGVNGSGTKLDNISDEDFINIINNSFTWIEILFKIGYSPTSSKDIKDRIRQRAEELGVTLNIRKRKERDWNYITKGEVFSYCKNWQSARTQIRKAAQKSFENSNKEYKCAICGYDKHVEIAHIKAVSEFDDSATIAEINAPSNLIGLCPNHHWEYDHGQLELPSDILGSPGGSSVS